MSLRCAVSFAAIAPAAPLPAQPRLSDPSLAHPLPVQPLLAQPLLAWYDRHRRDLPWRARPGEAADPYRVWLSEIMLQQTTVAAVIPYYESFVTRFPSIAALASAPLDAVLVAWAGLGYYARARNLHACAQAVVASGGFPRDLEGLRALPGIGPYTAAAVGAIAFGLPAVPVDGNVERVTARLFAIDAPLPGAKPALRAAAAALGADPDAMARPSDFAQALFDLGATLCTPTNPTCALCPWRDPCAARRAGIAADLPRRAPKKLRPLRHGAHFWLTDATGHVLLRQRPPHGLLGGMTELPGTAWRDAPWPAEEALRHAPMPADWRPTGEVRHGFTHFELRLDIFAARVERVDADGFLRPVTALANEALPSVMRKCVRMAGA
jgi:A/G-specific adenine glycosylase